MTRWTRRTSLAAAGAALAAPWILPRSALGQQKPAKLRIGISTFLSGPASVFGVPGRNAADLLISSSTPRAASRVCRSRPS